MKMLSSICLAAGLAAQAVPVTNLSWSLSRFARIEGKFLVVDVPPEKALVDVQKTIDSLREAGVVD